MILVLSTSEDATANYLVTRLIESIPSVERLDTDRFVDSASISYRNGTPEIESGDCRYTPDDVRHVWYRRPEGLRGRRFEPSPEGKYALEEWTAALEGFLGHIPFRRWMNHPSANASASHKMEQLTSARYLGLKTPDTIITQDPMELKKFFAAHCGRVVVKPMAGGRIKRAYEEDDRLIYTNQILESHLGDLSDLARTPTLFQDFIEKECDVRITVVDDVFVATALFAGATDKRQACDVRRNNMTDVTYREVQLPDTVRLGVRKVMRHYSLRFAAIDMALGVDGEWYFLEVNPNGQWAWLDLSAKTDIAGLFVRAFRKLE